MAISSDSSSVGRNVRRAFYSFSPLNSCFYILSGLVGSAPEQLALCLPSLEAALPTQRLCPLFIKPPEPSQAAAQCWLITGHRLGCDRAAMEGLETHYPLAKPGERLPLRSSGLEQLHT